MDVCLLWDVFNHYQFTHIDSYLQCSLKVGLVDFSDDHALLFVLVFEPECRLVQRIYECNVLLCLLHDYSIIG